MWVRCWLFFSQSLNYWSYAIILQILLQKSYKLTCHQSHEIIHYSFILLLKCYLIITSIYKLFVIKFIVSLAFSPKKKKKELIEMQPKFH